MKKELILHFNTRSEWRGWLAANYDKEKEVWFVFPLKVADEPTISYNDAVEEALCFGWIDSIIRILDDSHKIQRFSLRKPHSTYSQANKERLNWLLAEDLIHPQLRQSISELLSEEFVFPPDILEVIKADETAWYNYQQFSASYKRIRIAYIEAARKRPAEFQRRLNNFCDKTKKGKLIPGYGGIDKYY